MTELLQNEGTNPNPFIGIVLLTVLVVFVLPERLPQFLSDLSPYLFSGAPCGRLPVAGDLQAHQSVIGRSVQSPLRLELAPTSIADDGGLLLRLTIVNTSLGTIPIVFQPDNIAVAAEDDETNGIGIIVNPEPADGASERSNPDPGGYAESDIRLLGPKQRCVHVLELTASQAMIDDGGSAHAYYRMTAAGEHPSQNEAARTIYSDQGLDIIADGVVFSPEVEIDAATT